MSTASLQSIVTETNSPIFKALDERKRFRRKTDLDRLYRSISQEVSFEEFRATFKRLQDMGLGSLIIGRKNNPDRFAWNYNLKDVADAALTGKQELGELPKRVGRPRKTFRAKAVQDKVVTSTRDSSEAKTQSETVAQSLISAPMLQISFMVPANAPRSEIQALLDLAKDLQK